jgi:hypothetical protein
MDVMNIGFIDEVRALKDLNDELLAEISDTRNGMDEARQALLRAEQLSADLLASRSWRITRPLRLFIGAWRAAVAQLQRFSR